MSTRFVQPHISELLSRLDSARDTENGWTARCPAHDDNKNSLSIGIGSDNRVLLKCFAGCDAAQIVDAIGLQLRDLFPPRESAGTSLRRNPPPNKPASKPPEAPAERATVEALAARKRLPADWLRNTFHLRDLPGGNGVALPYFAPDGSQLFERKRAALVAKSGTFQAKGVKLKPYGMWIERKADFLIIVEGESDCWTLCHYSFPALGIPGASACKCIALDHLEGIARLYIWREFDAAGSKFTDSLHKHLRAIGFTGEIRVLAHSAYKDPSDWHCAASDAFPTEFRALLEATPTIEEERAKPLPTPDPLQPGLGDKSVVLLSHDNSEVTAHVTRLLAKDGELFNRGGTLVRPVTVEASNTPTIGRKAITMPAGSILLRPADAAYVALRISTHCILLNGKDRYVNPPGWLSASVLTAPGDIRQIAGVLPAPSVDHTGRLISTPGYDEGTKLYLASGAGDDLCVPDSPGREQAIDAAGRLLALVSEFPFETEHDRTRWLALVLTLTVRHMLDTSPLFLVTANAPGVGKTTLCNAASAIAHGRCDPITMAWPEASQSRGDELRKRLASLLHEAANFVVIDNLPRGSDFSAPELDAFVTSTSFTDRELGKNSGSRVGGPNKCVIAATGNAVAAAGDTADRTVSIRLVTDHPSPRSRPLESFTLRDFVGHLLANRSALLSDVLTIWRAWLLAGQPHPDGPSWGSFVAWNASVGAVIRWMGLPDVIADREKIMKDTDRESQALFTLITKWDEVAGPSPVTAGELLARLGGDSSNVSRDVETVREAILALIGTARPTWPISPVRLGKLLASYNRAVVTASDGSRLQLVGVADSHANQKHYRINRTCKSSSGVCGDGGCGGDKNHHLTRDVFSSTSSQVTFRNGGETPPPSPQSYPSDTPIRNAQGREVYRL